jgi:hypothetical protein
MAWCCDANRMDADIDSTRSLRREECIIDHRAPPIAMLKARSERAFLLVEKKLTEAEVGRDKPGRAWCAIRAQYSLR